MTPHDHCGRSENFDAILATAEHAAANGKYLVLALAVAYEVQGHVTVAVPRGFTGPMRLFEGPNGLKRMIGQTIAVGWNDASLEVIKRVQFLGCGPSPH